MGDTWKGVVEEVSCSDSVGSGVLEDKVEDCPAVKDEYCWCGGDGVLKGECEGLCFSLIYIGGGISNGLWEGMVSKVMRDCGKGVPRGICDGGTSAKKNGGGSGDRGEGGRGGRMEMFCCCMAGISGKYDWGVVFGNNVGYS